jgi:hypothetical protein
MDREAIMSRQKARKGQPSADATCAEAVRAIGLRSTPSLTTPGRLGQALCHIV